VSTHRKQGVAAHNGLPFSSEAYKLRFSSHDGPFDPVSASIKVMMIGVGVMYGLGLALTLAGCVLAAVSPATLLMMLGFGMYIAVFMACALLGLAVNVGRNIWKHGTVLNRFNLIAMPACIAYIVWANQDVVLHATDALGRGLYGGSGLYFGGNLLVAFVITIFVQALVWAALLGLPVLAMHGLSMNQAMINNDNHRTTAAKVGPVQTVFYHLAASYGFGLLAIAAWFPYFMAL